MDTVVPAGTSPWNRLSSFITAYIGNGAVPRVLLDELNANGKSNMKRSSVNVGKAAT